MPTVGHTYTYPNSFGAGTYKVKVTKVTKDRVAFKIISGPSKGSSRSMTRNQWAAKVGR